MLFNCEMYTNILTYMTKETFFAKSAMQSPNIQPGLLLAKMKGQQSLHFFIFCQPLGYFTWFVKSKSLLIEVFHNILSVMFSQAQLL